MTHHVYPDPQNDPLRLAAGETSAPSPIENLFGSGTGIATMFIRYVLVGVGCAPPASPNLTVFLITDGTDTEIKSRNRVNPTPVAADNALATVIPQDRAVFLLEVSTRKPDSIKDVTWQIRFRNNDPTAAHQLTWVVADGEAETRQPWIELPAEAVWPTVPSGAQPGQGVSLPVKVANKGTGNLLISDVPGPLATSVFKLSAVPASIAPNACGDLVFEFIPPANSGTSKATYTAACNDSTAGAGPSSAAHNKRLELIATVGIPEPAFNDLPPQFTPPEGAPGETVTLNGRNFDVGIPRVQFGTVAATRVGVPTQTGVTAVVPAELPPGDVSITVTTDGGKAVSSVQFKVKGFRPQIDRFTPSRGQSEDPPAPGTEVTIIGNHFIGETKVKFGDRRAAIVGVADREIRTKVPDIPSGDYAITVETTWGSKESEDLFTVLPRPVFSASSPQFEPSDGVSGTRVTLNGRNFGFGTPQVRFGTVAAELVGLPTQTGVTAIAPRLPAGPEQITVTTEGGTAISQDFFTMRVPPQLDGFTPSKGNPETPTDPATVVTITGSNFDENANRKTTVTFGDRSAVVDNVTSNRILTKVPTIPNGAYTIIVATRWGEARSRDSFAVVRKPEFNDSPAQFSPSRGTPGTVVTLNGRNFDVGIPEVRFGTVAAESVGAPTPTGVTAVVPVGLARGAVKITVSTAGGTATSQDSFTVHLPPQLAGFTPPEGNPATPTDLATVVTITGSHFDENIDGQTTVAFGDRPAVIDNITNTRILTKVPPVPDGSYSIIVTSQWGEARSTDPFIVSIGGRFAQRRRIRAFRRDANKVLILAQGNNPGPGHRVDIKQSRNNAVPPQFDLLRVPVDAANPPRPGPYRYEEVVPFPPDKPRITINHAEGSDVVNIGQTYVVQRGDTMGEIAARFRMSLQALAAANPQIPNINRINPGQLINIPLTYVVQRGDTMGEIAVKFEISLEALKAENPQISDINRIRPGQVIVIP